jgi:hypothetical protein
MKTKKFIKKISGILLAMAIVISSTIPILAAEPSIESAVDVVKGEVVFRNLENISEQSFTSMDDNGNEYTVSIEAVESPMALARTASRTWKISFTGVIINCSFYMVVSGNKCTSVYDRWIMTIGCTYSGASLTRSSTYGRLSFDATAIQGLAKTSCWLKGTVTGSNNDVKVSYQM